MPYMEIYQFMVHAFDILSNKSSALFNSENTLIFITFLMCTRFKQSDFLLLPLSSITIGFNATHATLSIGDQEMYVFPLPLDTAYKSR